MTSTWGHQSAEATYQVDVGGSASRPGPDGPSRDGVFLAWYTCKLLCDPALRMYSGIGGVTFLSGSISPSPSPLSSSLASLAML